MSNANTIGIGLVAGLAGGLMALAGLHSTSFAFFLMFSAPLAIAVASLGWGPLSGMLAAVVAVIIVAIQTQIEMAVATATLLFLPVAWAGHLANLAQPSPDNRQMVWFPLSGILFRLMIALFAGFIITGWISGFSAEKAAAAFAELLNEMAKNEPELPQIPEGSIEQNARVFAGILPIAIPAVFLMAHVLVLYLAAMVTRASGKLPRPRDDIPATANLPAIALGITPLGLIAMGMFASPLYEIGGVMAGIGIAGLGLVGLADMHFSMRGKPGGQFAIFVSWFALMVLSLPLVLFALFGAWRVIRSMNPPQPPVFPPANRT
ncbi:MAG: hypothetical protein R3D32_12050 [Nitratireductor sp.]